MIPGTSLNQAFVFLSHSRHGLTAFLRLTVMSCFLVLSISGRLDFDDNSDNILDPRSEKCLRRSLVPPFSWPP
jgi:hypothetical protein